MILARCLYRWIGYLEVAEKECGRDFFAEVAEKKYRRELNVNFLLLSKEFPRPQDLFQKLFDTCVLVAARSLDSGILWRKIEEGESADGGGGDGNIAVSMDADDYAAEVIQPRSNHFDS